MRVGTVLSKPFDSIDSSLLLMKLHAYGVEDMEMEWFTDYLSEHEMMKVLFLDNLTT